MKRLLHRAIYLARSVSTDLPLHKEEFPRVCLGVPGTDVTQIEAGDHHTCALKTDQTVVCWGGNQYGQLNVPGGLGSVVQVNAGGEQSCAVKADGTMVCWGGYVHGEATVPSGLSSVVRATTGWYHTCALKSGR